MIQKHIIIFDRSVEKFNNAE